MYEDFLSPKFKDHILKSAIPFPGVPELMQVGASGGLENKESMKFLCDLYELTKKELQLVLNRRVRDRKFIDERTRAMATFNKDLKRDFLSPDYKTIFGLEDGEGRIVMGPRSATYADPKPEKRIAPIPEFLQGNHVTLFGPPDNAKLSINAMNAYHRKLKDEPKIVQELLDIQTQLPKWGADDEDSKTPLREDLISAGENLTACLDGTISLTETKKYELEKDHLSLPIKRFPGLALPCYFLFCKNEALPLHLYDFALHLFKNWHNKKALCFYVPKLENEEEARYIRIVMETAETMIKRFHPEYQIGSIRLMIVLENPRAVFRVHEIMDELYPYFVGASLGWHDYLASTARLFKEDSHYRIPVKADPDIVIKYIKASHDLLAEVVGSRGGVKVGGMYGILPNNNDLKSDSFQVTIKGYIRDVVTQFKRDLTGFWVAHPDFVRLGLALVEAWNIHKSGDSSKLEELVKSLLNEKYHQEVLGFIHGPDIKGLDKKDPMYPRSLIVADIRESNFIANNHPDEIRYNVFQSLQYITDWLSGNGCVALPAHVGDVAVRVMDDLATAERSRWEVWHEIYHGRTSLEDFLRIAHEELHFIRKDKSNEKKIVQVKWDERTQKWYPVAMNLMIKLMTDKNPVEFATQLFLPFTLQTVRNSQDPWAEVLKIDEQKFAIRDDVERFNFYFEKCGSQKFATELSHCLVIDPDHIDRVVRRFSREDILEAASFHGDIGEGKKTLDRLALGEQAKVFGEDELIKDELRIWGKKYLEKFGVKFLISAQGKSGTEMLKSLKDRFENTEVEEWENAKNALAQIAIKRMKLHPINSLHQTLENVLNKHGVKAAQVAIMTHGKVQTLSLGETTKRTWFEMASLSKTMASAFALEYFKTKKIPLHSPVNELLSKTKSTFRIPSGDKVHITHLMSHSALNMHYVNGVPSNKKMPPVRDFLEGNSEYGYPAISVVNTPGEVFQYSGGGFLVLEHLIESLENKSIFELTQPFFEKLGLSHMSFRQENLPGVDYAHGFNDQGFEIEGTRKMFPAFAAGAMGTATDMANFLVQLEDAYQNLCGPGGISHDTARLMLHGTDKGCMNFMGVKMGLGVFVGEAGLNKFAIHQGANDGFRCIYLHTIDGPDTGKGFVVLCNSDLKGVLFNAKVTQELLQVLKIEGVDTSKFKSEFRADTIAQEEIVNIGYKNLVFSAFAPTRPEPITDRGPKDPLALYNLCAGGRILSVSDEKFAQADNLLSDHLPKFDPELFGKQGKVMDSWETVRHNLKGVDTLTFELKKPSSIRYVLLSTKYHFGNHSPVIRLEGLKDQEWVEVLPKTPIEGHSEIRLVLSQETAVFSQIRVSQYPDGGFSRLGLYQELPEAQKASFVDIKSAKSIVYEEKIPQTSKPLSIKYEVTLEEVKQNLSVLKNGEEFNNASSSFGAKIISATNEHYSPASQVISPFSPINMFDGMESARSRKPGNFEEVVLSLALPLAIHRLEMDFTYFVNNNPLEVNVLGLSDGKWISLVDKVNVKAFAGGKRDFKIENNQIIEQIKIQTWPDGGMNRFKAYSFFKSF